MYPWLDASWEEPKDHSVPFTELTVVVVKAVQTMAIPGEVKAGLERC